MTWWEFIGRSSIAFVVVLGVAVLQGMFEHAVSDAVVEGVYGLVLFILTVRLVVWMVFPHES